VQIAFKDAEAYAQWRASDATEAEWEFAARAADGAEFAWARSSRRRQAHGQHLQGNFPIENDKADGFARTSPVRCVPANGTACTT